MSMVTVTILSPPTSLKVTFGTNGSFVFIGHCLGAVGGEPLDCCVLVLAEFGAHEYVSQEREFADRDCHTWAPGGDALQDVVFMDGVSDLGAVDEVVARFWVLYVY